MLDASYGNAIVTDTRVIFENGEVYFYDHQDGRIYQEITIQDQPERAECLEPEICMTVARAALGGWPVRVLLRIEDLSKHRIHKFDFEVSATRMPAVHASAVECLERLGCHCDDLLTHLISIRPAT